MKKLLSICLPTFNRPEKAKTVVNYIVSEMKEYHDEIDFFIADNSDNLETSRLLSEVIETHPITYIKNGTNLGCVGSMYRLSSIANSEYIWFMSDDDLYSVGLIKKIIDILKANSTGLIFINHGAFSDKAIYKPVYTKARHGKLDDSFQTLFDLFQEVRLELHLISCLVYKKQYFDDIKSTISPNNAAQPLAASFYSILKEGVYITDFIGLQSNWTTPEWNDSLPKIYTEDILEVFDSLIHHFNYPEVDSLRRFYLSLDQVQMAFKSYFHTNPSSMMYLLYTYKLMDQIPLKIFL